MSEAVVEASSSRTSQRWLTGRPKRMRILGYGVKSPVVTIPHRYRRKAATYGHKPITLRNGITRCRLSAMAEQVTSRMPQRVGCPEKPRP